MNIDKSTGMADAEYDKTSVIYESFHGGLSKEPGTDDDSDVFDLDGEMLPQLI